MQRRAGSPWIASFCGALGVLAIACDGEAPETAPPATEAPRPAGPPTSPSPFSLDGSDTPVSLRFEWPDGARASVEASRSLERQGVGTTGRAIARYRISIERRGERTTLRSRELSIHPAEGGPGENLAGMMVATTFLPSARFTHDVDALTLFEPERSSETLRDAVTAAVTPEARALPGWPSLEPIVTGEPEMMRRQAQSLLAPIMTLDGLEVESERSVSARTRRPTQEGPAADQSTTTRLLGTGPCFEGDGASGCASVEIVARYTADPSVTTPGPGGGTVLSMEGRLRLLVEPRTLLPHRMEAVKTTRFVVPGEGDAPSILTEVETLGWEFSWSQGTIRD